MKISEMVLKRAQEDLDQVPDSVQSAVESLSVFEETYGREATIKLIESTVVEEIQRTDEADRGYVVLLMSLLADIKSATGTAIN